MIKQFGGEQKYPVRKYMIPVMEKIHMGTAFSFILKT